MATPIGNLRDVTLRALDVLAGADAIYAEDTRVTRKLLDAYGIPARPQPYHEHNAEAVRPRALAALAAGGRIALVTDAGTPLVSDPGYKLVRAALEANHRVWPIPGASAVLAALVTAGLPTDRFLFAGFLPAKPAARQRALREFAAAPATLVLFETGPRLAESLAAMAATLGDRQACVARELTKRFEETRRGSLAGLAAAYAAEPAPKGELAIVIAPPAPPEAAPEALIDAALDAAMQRLSLGDAAAEVARAFGLSRRDVYARALSRRSAPDAEEQ